MGFLRLLFATLVIVSHGPELVTGDQSAELLHRIFGTLTFGNIAVDGFFLISGYLITKSFLRTPDWRSYLLKRVLRIYPGFLVASILSLTIAPFVGAHMEDVRTSTHLIDLVLLSPPIGPGAFDGNIMTILNGSLWTIAYEFRCYLLVLGLGLLGLLERRRTLLAATATLLVVFCLPVSWPTVPPVVWKLVGVLSQSLRFTMHFMCGMMFFLYRDQIRYTAAGAAAAASALVALMFVPALAEAAFSVLGGYLIFWLAFTVRPAWMTAVGAKADFSYGTYLYAWPVQSWIIWMAPHLSPWLVVPLTIIAVAPLAAVSWYFVEKPFLRFKGLAAAPRSAREAVPQ